MPGGHSRRAVLRAFGALGVAGVTAASGCTSSTRVPMVYDSQPILPPRPGSTVGPGSAPASPKPSPVRAVQTVTGTVQVPKAPRRVVVLGTAELDSALTLGLVPVGAARPMLDRTLADYFPKGWLDSVAQVGVIGDPDLDLVARLQPDLILTNQAQDGGRYAKLAAIAPTVMTESTGASWKQDFQLHAQALNRQVFADAITAALEDHVHQVTAALGGSGATRKQRISLVRFVQDAPPRAYGTQNFLGSLLAELQLGRPPGQNVPAFEVAIPSTTSLGIVDGTAILYGTYGDPAKAQTAEVTGGDAWKKLSAVRARRAFPVDDRLWYLGIGYYAGNLILAQLQRCLGG
jgi:iron complex transport system substrate-binding protein